MTGPMRHTLVLIIALLLGPRHLVAAPVDFVREVRPILEKHCYACHGEKEQKSGLRLDIREAAFKGGDGYGPSIVPNKAGDSPLIQLVSSGDKDERMPPQGEGLSKAEIDLLTTWINSGAVWPAGVDRARLED
jgi:mono/diheme cytochrome c family protein